MSNKNCCICSSVVDIEKADILTMGGFGVPRCLCEECTKDLNTVTRGAVPSEITAAIDKLGKKMSSNGVDDRYVIQTMNDIFKEASDRAEKIKNGTYDFSLDEKVADDGTLDEIPPELEESEEDKLLDEKEQKASKKMDKIINWISAGIFIAAIAFLLYYYLS